MPDRPPLPGIEQQLRTGFDRLTRAERQLASHILRNYPVAALGSITALAKAAGVSTPTVVRLVQKIGFKGDPDFQNILRGEVEEMLLPPLVKHERWAQDAPDTHVLNRFADATLGAGVILITDQWCRRRPATPGTGSVAISPCRPTGTATSPSCS